MRTRISVLSEMVDRWEARVARWLDLARPHQVELHGQLAPSANDLYLFFQVVVGAWPMPGASADLALVDRLGAYMAKAVREAKTETSWTTPDARYEAAVANAVAGLLADCAFTDDVTGFVSTIAPHGACNSLAQLALRLASPGIPDIYQGCELWDLSLVDPDNRRPVDYALRRELVRELATREVTPALA